VATAAWDIAKIAGCVLSNIPGVQLVWCAVAGAVGAITSLGRFYVKEYLKDPKDPTPTDDERQRVLDRARELAAHVVDEAAAQAATQAVQTVEGLLLAQQPAGA
jgi:hypothetical protein